MDLQRSLLTDGLLGLDIHIGATGRRGASSQLARCCRHNYGVLCGSHSCAGLLRDRLRPQDRAISRACHMVPWRLASLFHPVPCGEQSHTALIPASIPLLPITFLDLSMMTPRILSSLGMSLLPTATASGRTTEATFAGQSTHTLPAGVPVF